VTPADNRNLILSAATALNPHTVGDRLFGDVASELITSTGTHYQGVCIDTRAPSRCASSCRPTTGRCPLSLG